MREPLPAIHQIQTAPQLASPRVLVLGLGNPLLGDDSVGWRVAAHVQQILADMVQQLAFVCEVDCLAVGGLRLMERLVSYEGAILIDAVVTGQNPPGSIYVFALEDLPDPAAGHLVSAHDTTLQFALKLGSALGIALPKRVIIVGIETRHTYDFTETLTPAVAAAIPEASRLIVEMLRQPFWEE